MLAVLWMVGLLQADGGEALDLPVVEVGATLEDEVTDEDAVAHTQELDANYADAPVLRKSFSIEVPEAGPYWIELRSYLFDAYLVLRDGERILAEDDDGGLGTHARITAELQPGQDYQLDACALHGERGPFELRLEPGHPPELSRPAEHALELEEFRRTIASHETALGPEHPHTARSLGTIAFLLYAQGDYPAARPYFERALAIQEKVLGPEHQDTATALNNLAALLWAQGDYARAQACHERALAIREKVLGPEHQDTAQSLNNLGIVFHSRGEYDAAREYYERALAIREEVLGPEHPDTAQSLNNLAAVLDTLGDFSAARLLYGRALAIRTKALGPEHPDTAQSLNNLAFLLRAQGDTVAARPYFERALAIRETVLGPEHPETAGSLDNLAFVLYSQGDYAGARPYLQRALAIWEKALGPEHRDTINALNDLAVVVLAQGDHAAARPIFERALALQERVLGPQHPDTARTLDNLALLLLDQGDVELARPIFERALAIRERALGSENPDTATSIHDLAHLLWTQGAHDAARTNFERALAIREKLLGAEHPDTAKTLDCLALVDLDRGKPASAWTLARRAWSGSRLHQRQLLASLSEAESYAYLASVRVRLDTLLSVSRSLPAPSLEAYDPVLAWKGQVARQMQAGRERLLAGLEGEQLELVEQLRACQAQLSRLAFQRDVQERVEHEQRLESLRQQRNELELELRRSLREEPLEDISCVALAASLPGGSALVDFLVHGVYRAARREGESVVELGAWQEPRLSAWITRPEREGVVSLDLGPATALATAVRTFLEDLISRRGFARAEPDDPGAELRALLWEPIAAHLAGVATVFVSPDGFLGTLPFEVLQLADESFLVEHHSFVYLQDPASLVHGEPRTAVLDSLLCAGGIDYKQRARGTEAVEAAASPVVAAVASLGGPDLRGSFEHHWAPLRHTAYEAEVVNSLHEDAFGQGERLLLRGSAATEERLKRELPAYSVVHVATHGFFNPEGVPSLWESALRAAREEGPQFSEEAPHLVGQHPGLLTGLVCAGANAEPEEGRDDGYLTAEEVGWLDLSEVELVVLSACETALGRAQSGEGLLGLRRAFEQAGAKTVISSRSGR